MLVFSAAVLQDNLWAEEEREGEGGREASDEASTQRRLFPSLYPDVSVLMDFRQVQHVVQGQHSRRSLGKVHCWVDMVL